MKKIICTLLISCLMMATLGMPVLAQEPDASVTQSTQNSIEPVLRWNDTAYVDVSAYVNGTNVTAFVSVGADNPNMTCKGTLYLERYVNGRWNVVASTGVSGTGAATASVSAAGIKNNIYRARINVKVGSDTLTNISRSVTFN